MPRTTTNHPDLFDQAEPRGEAGRDLALARLEEHRALVVSRLRNAAWETWHRTHAPVSVNDVRHVLDEEHYEGDPRILGTTFPPSEWDRVGEDRTNSLLANARAIRLFVPRNNEGHQWNVPR